MTSVADDAGTAPAATPAALPVWTTCPTCSSSRPHLHPTADLCPDPFHRPEPATAQEWRAEVSRWADLLDQIGGLPAGTGLDAVARIVADMRREIAAAPTTRDAEPHQARRGDDVDTWIKAARDQQNPDGTAWDLGRWNVLDDLLQDYRIHADYGVPLSRAVHEPPCAVSEGCDDCYPTKETPDAR